MVNEPEGEMCSQFVPLPVTAAVKAVARLAVTDTVCEAGAAPPAVALNVREVGLTVTVGRVTLSVTLTVWVLRFSSCPDVREIVPL